MRSKLRFLLAISLLADAASCSRAPSLDVLGSFFPAWMVCCVLGSVLAIATYFVLVRLNFHSALPWHPIVYPCFALIYTFLTWIIFYR